MTYCKTKGRKLSPLELETLGEIEINDILTREEGGLATSESPTLARLRGVHHEIARLLATGLTPVEVAATTGYSLSRISVLQNDPSFKELLTFYKQKSEEVFVDVHKRMATLGLDAAAELQERLDTKPETLSASQLIDISKMALDRAGYAPVTKNVNVGVQMSADELAELRNSTGGNNVKVLDTIEADYSVKD